MGLKVKIYFVGDRFGCWVYGFGCFIGDLGLKGDELRSAVIGANQGEGTSEPSHFALRVLPQLTMSRARGRSSRF